MTYILSDVIPVIEKLNLAFKKDSVNLSTVKPVVNGTKGVLHALLVTPGSK